MNEPQAHRNPAASSPAMRIMSLLVMIMFSLTLGSQILSKEIITTKPGTWRSATVFNHVIWKNLLFYGGGSGSDGGDPHYEIEIIVLHLNSPDSGYHDPNNPAITHINLLIRL